MREKLHDVIFGTTTKSGRNFDVILLVFIVLSVFLVMFESMKTWSDEYPLFFYYAEWAFTIFFTIEYILRLAVSHKPLKYMFSAWGIIDLLAIMPTYLALAPFINSYASLRAIRALRLLRVFRILKLNRFTSESQALFHSLRASYYKIMVFFFFVLMIVTLTGTLMYVIEGGEHGFDSIPDSIYWAIVTTTTVGYGDITPATELGKILSSFMMITGYVIIAVPTGLITVGMARYKADGKEDNLCEFCEHDNPFGSIYCNQCGHEVIS